MRRFIVIGHRAKTTGDFTLNDLPGSGGRLDILARCVNSAFFLSHDLRRNVELYLVLCGGEAVRTIRLVGDELRYLNPDERSTGALLRNALLKFNTTQAISPATSDGEQLNEIRSTPGIYISDRGFQDVLVSCAEISKIIYLSEEGEDIRGFELSKQDQDYTFVLGDDKGLAEHEEEILQKYDPMRVSLSPLILHADHCIILAHRELDEEFLSE
jgi:tRNA (pseudouridine54-N1)-methyltransferase